MGTIFERYVTSPPDAQQALDIFKGMWSCAFPPPFTHLVAGKIQMSGDVRIAWGAELLGGFVGKNVLELGPLEGMHTFLLEQHGAASITAIESNTTAYLKCLVTKDILGLTRSTFLCGDFVEYLRASQRTFDACIASGVLYHMRRPVEALGLIARTTDRVVLWTHYYDETIINQRPELIVRFAASGHADFGGFTHMLYRQEYDDARQLIDFCGGSAPYSYWMRREDILACLRFFGFDELHVGLENLIHPGGPSFAITAIRTDPSTRPTDAQLQAVYHLDPLLMELEAEQVDTPSAPRDAPLSPNTQAYIAHLEDTIAVKNEHIARIERLIERVNAGRVMRILQLLRRPGRTSM